MNRLPAVSRREWFSSVFRGLKQQASQSKLAALARGGIRNRIDRVPMVAVIQGRFCLAYQNSFCSTCSERCPEPGAMVVDAGLPRVVPQACTGCAICHDVCPAPKNAILMARKRPSP